MFLRYEPPGAAAYQHAVAEAELVPLAESNQDSLGNLIGIRKRYTIRGMLQADSPTQLTTRILALEAAYSISGGKLGLYHAPGVPTAHVIQDVRIVRPPSYPIGIGGEYTTYRTYEIEVEAGVPAIVDGGGGQQQLLSFQESFQQVGGGPQFAYLPLLSGAPQRQIIRQQTPYRAVQVGRAAGTGGYPPFPSPQWPSQEHIDQRMQSRQRPLLNPNTSQTEYVIDWAYHYESETQFTLPSG